MKILDWNEYHGYIDKLAEQIKNSSDSYKYLFGANTDDLVVAAHLSHKLNIPMVTDVSLLTFLYNVDPNEEDLLVVANVVHTGKTIKSVMEQLKCTFDTAVLFKDSACTFTPTYYVHIPLKIIVFPWEDVKNINRKG